MTRDEERDNAAAGGGGEPDPVGLGRLVCDSLDVALDVDQHVPSAAYAITYDEPTGRVLVERTADGAIYDATAVVPVRRVPGLDSIRVEPDGLELLAAWLGEPARQLAAAHRLRELQAEVAIDEAEFYASGRRRLTVHYGPAPGDPTERQRRQDLIDALVEQIEAAADGVGYVGGGLTGHHATASGGRHTTVWSWPSTDVPAEAIVRAALAVAERLNPGHWRIDADDHE